MAASLVTMIVILPRRLSLRNSTLPLISASTAGSLGLRASKISVTRGRPPTMSAELETSRGWRASMCPASITWPSLTSMRALAGR